MADETTTAEPQTPPTQPQGQQGGQEPGPVPYERFKQVNEQYKALERKLAALEDADKKRKDAELSELEKWQKTAAEREADLVKERLANAKLRVINDKKLPADLEEFLTGNTPEELAEKADKLLQFVGKPVTAPGVPPAGRNSKPARLDLSSMSPEEIRKNAGALYKQGVSQQ